MQEVDLSQLSFATLNNGCIKPNAIVNFNNITDRFSSRLRAVSKTHIGDKAKKYNDRSNGKNNLDGIQGGSTTSIRNTVTKVVASFPAFTGQDRHLRSKRRSYETRGKRSRLGGFKFRSTDAALVEVVRESLQYVKLDVKPDVAKDLGLVDSYYL